MKRWYIYYHTTPC